MIILNKNLEVIYPININKILEKILLILIKKKAYKGYVYYLTLEGKKKYLSYTEFKKMDIWKIKFSFQIYLERLKKVNGLGFNPNNKILLQNYFKDIWYIKR